MADADDYAVKSWALSNGGGQLREFPQPIVMALLRESKSLHLVKGEVLFARGDPGDSCFLVRRGVVKVSIGSARGEQRILALHGRGALVGELSMIDGLPRAVTAQAMSECHLAAITRTSFMACLGRHPEIGASVISILAGRLRRAGEESAWAGLLPARARVARALLRVAEVMGQEVGVGRIAIDRIITHADIAAMAGVSREEASRAVGAWKRTGAVNGDARATFVVDIEALQAAASEGLTRTRP
jgi:CRP/FNR family transcriptional regulator, cyclic AMP receptor protein